MRSARIPQRPLHHGSLLAVLGTFLVLAFTIIILQHFQSFVILSLFYVELLILLMLMLLLALIPRNNSSDYWKKYSFNSAGILVNGHLVYPWTDVRGLSFSMRVDRRDQNVAETWSLRTISSVPSRNGRLVPIYRTFNYGALEVFSHLSTKPSLVVKCPRSFSTATRLFRKMKEFSNETNPNINFRILSSLDKKDRMVEETTRT